MKKKLETAITPKDKKQIIREFNEFGPNYFSRFENSNLLFSALNNDDINLVEFLLMNGADPNIPNRSMDYPVKFAILNNRIDLYELLVKYGADKFKMDDLNSDIFLLSIIYSELETIKYILDFHPNYKIETVNRQNALTYSALRNDLDIFEFVLNLGFDYEEHLNLLVSNCLNVENSLVLDFLISEGIKFNETIFAKNQNIFHYICSSISEKSEPNFSKILELEQIDVNSLDSKSLTPLFYAIENKKDLFAILLLEKGASLNFENRFGQNIFDFLSFENDLLIPYLYKNVEKFSPENKKTFMKIALKKLLQHA